MHIKRWKWIGIVLGVFFLVNGCGYIPSSHAMKNLFDDAVYVEVNVDRGEPENAPYVKDELNRIILNRFGGRIVPKSQAKTFIYVSYAGSYFRPLTYRDGYVTRYRVYVNVIFDMLTKKGELHKKIRSIYDADIQESSLASSTLRIEAIRKGLEKAMDQFVAYASAKGLMPDKQKK